MKCKRSLEKKLYLLFDKKDGDMRRYRNFPHCDMPEKRRFTHTCTEVIRRSIKATPAEVSTISADESIPTSMCKGQGRSGADTVKIST